MRRRTRKICGRNAEDGGIRKYGLLRVAVISISYVRMHSIISMKEANANETNDHNKDVTLTSKLQTV